MLCEKCKNLKESTEDLEDWCAKNCKPVEEKTKQDTKSKEEKKD